jgi:hypothetical protein
MATKTTQGEKWKVVSFGFKFTNDYELQVSNMGQLKAFNKFSDGEVLQGSTINGYRIVRLKLYKPKDKKTVDALKAEHEVILNLQAKINSKKKEHAKSSGDAAKKLKKEISESTAHIKGLKAVLRKKRQQDIKDRTMHYHSLIHRLVAENFVKPKSPKHTVVGHIDYDKMNNQADNLKWMTPEENYKHQQQSPNVIAEKRDRVTIYKDHPRGAKLSVEKVAELKKALAEGKKIKALVKKFKITDTQILRIKRGENWADVAPAK